MGMPGRAFPVIYSRAVEQLASFYQRLGFEPHFRLPPEGEAGYVGLRRGETDLAIVNAQWPEQQLGVQVGSQPRFELFVYVEDVDELVARLGAEGVSILREPQDMPWGERVAYVADPEQNPVALARGTATR